MNIFQSILPYFQIGISILLIVFVLIQQKGAGLSGVFGGEGSFYHTKRGLEKIVFTATIILASLFIILAILSLIF